MGIGIAFVVAVAVAAGYGLLKRTGGVDGPEARRLVAAGALLLDVRTREEFSGGHITGAVNIPVQELDGRIGEIESKDRPVVVYCRSGLRSGRAASMLVRGGYHSVHDLGAMGRW